MAYTKMASEELAELKKYVSQHGVEAMARTCGVHREVLLRAMAEMPIQRGSKLAIQQFLGGES